MESSENSARENCQHFTTPPLVFLRLSMGNYCRRRWILPAFSGFKKSTLTVNFTAKIPLKFWRGSEKKRVSRGWHLWRWSFHIQSWSLCNKSVESFLILVDILNSASRILQCWSYYVKINSARHSWFSLHILRDCCDVIQTYPYHDTGAWNFCMPKGSGEFLSWLDQTQQIPGLLRC